MDMTLIQQLIGSLGFPIFISIWLLIRSEKKDKEHKEETDSLRNVIEHNTEVLQSIKDKLEFLERVIDQRR